ncbi:MAG: O-antigen ligase family protein [Patescibacteria group bacterium]
MDLFRKNILKYGTYFLVFILPLIYVGSRIYPHISSKPFFFYGVVDILISVLLYTLFVDPSYRLPKKNILYFLPVIGFLIWMTLAGILAVDVNLSFWSTLSRGTGLLTLYHSLLFAFIIASLVYRDGKEYIQKLLQYFVAGGFVLSLSLWFGSGGFNLPYKFLRTDGGGGLTGNSSVAAAYLMFVFVFGIFLLTVKEISKKTKILISIALATIIFSPIFINVYGLFNGGSLLGNARGALLGIIVGVGSTGLGLLSLSKKKILRTLGIVGIVLSLIVFAFGWKQLVTPNTFLHQKFTQVASGTRFILGDAAQKAMNDHPWFGYGPENQAIAFQAHFNPKMLLAEYNYEGYADRFHNIYYDIGASAGYPAIIFYLIFILSILFCLYKLKEKEILTTLQASLFFGLVVGYVFQNLFFFDSVLSFMVLFSFIGIVFGLQNNSIENNKFKITDGYAKNLIAGVLVILCIISFIYFLYRPYKKLDTIGRVFSKQINKPFSELEGRSVVGDVWDIGGLAHDTFGSLFKNAVAIKNNKQVLPYILKDLDNFLKYLEVVRNENPSDYRLNISIVDLYNTKAYLSDTPNDENTRKHILEILDHILVISPTNPEVYWRIAQVYSWTTDLNSAEKAYRDAIALDPSIPVSHTFFINFAKNKGDDKLYKEAVDQAQKDIPNFKL